MILATLIRAAIVISIFVLPPMAGCRKPFKELALGETFWPTVAATLFDDALTSDPAPIRPGRVETSVRVSGDAIPTNAHRAV
jgi:hypothetical protein